MSTPSKAKLIEAIAEAVTDETLLRLWSTALRDPLRLLNATQAAKRIGISRNEIKFIGAKPIRIGRRPMYREADLEAALLRHQSK